MKIIELEITEKHNGKEIKTLLFNELKLSQRLVTKLKKGDGIKLNSKRETVRKTVTTGDILTVTIYDELSENIVPNNIPLSVVYEDDEILVVNKPYNMPTHPSINHYENTLANAVMYYYRDIKFTFRAINRLDRDTTGLVLIAKNSYSANELSKQLQKKQIKKTYFAICRGKLPQMKGIIEAPIMRESESVIKRLVSPDGQYALTEYEILKYENGYSLVKAYPKTGRTHQIRVHFAHIGNPLYADFIYGEEIENERTRLHCYSLEFLHPSTKEKLVLNTPYPDDFFIKYEKEL